jgi:hypothetical protein
MTLKELKYEFDASDDEETYESSDDGGFEEDADK